MGRWKPDARSRLEQAAIELYGERGFEQTTVAEIAKQAGLTERTFFRHFADKREVLFSGGALLEESIVNAVATAPRSKSPFDAAGVGVEAATTLLQARREYARQRQAIVSKSPELQERERIKLASLAAALAAALRQRGVNDTAASLAAEMGIAVFRLAVERWLNDANHQDLSHIVRESLQELKAITSGKEI